ncbi:MAG: glycolate oxidase subunit GlcE, partial [Gammaproteobacteria bacterium]
MTDHSPANEALAQLVSQVRTAAEEHSALTIEGGGSKHFLGRLTQAPTLSTRGLSGIVSYEPTELVLTALAGTPLSEVEASLREKDQMLVFEPPHFGANATVGGAIASGLSGPRRPFAGAVRDFVLGTRVLNGKGEVLAFGGQVMKNVAGYDISRLMTGALGSLGVIVEVSLKVLPLPGATQTLGFDMSASDAVAKVNEWAGSPIPLSAACHDGERLRVRIEGTPRAVAAVAARLGGDCEEEHARGEAGVFWTALRE